MARTITLPKSLPDPAQWERLVARYKAFRLLSLELSPEAFSSNYAREAAFAPETWASRLSNPMALNAVVVSSGSSADGGQGDGEDEDEDEASLLLRSEWLAGATLIGPLDADTAEEEYRERMGLGPSTPSSPDNTEFFGPRQAGVDSVFVLNAMYVLPSERRKGLAELMIGHAKRLARERGGGGGDGSGKVALVLIVAFENEPARRAYEKSGFEIVHRAWHDDPRSSHGETRGRAEAAVMRVDLNLGLGPGDA